MRIVHTFDFPLIKIDNALVELTFAGMIYVQRNGVALQILLDSSLPSPTDFMN